MKRNWRGVAVFFGVWLLVFWAARFSWQLGAYYSHANRFSLYVSQKDSKGARNALDSLRVSYIRINWWGIEWLTKRTIFRHFPLYEAEYARLIGDYDEANNILKDINNPLAYHIRGSANFELAQALYRRNKNSPQIKSVVLEACENFENALRHSWADLSFSDDMWNFDICDPSNLMQALAKEKTPLVIFGFPDEKDMRPAKPGQGPPGQLLPQRQSQPGQSSGGRKRP